MITYARWSPVEKAGDMAVHVRAHLSSVTSEDDDPDQFASDVQIVVVADGDGVMVTGRIDRDPIADYLRDEFDPEQDVVDNPLSVPSIEGGWER